MDQLFTANGQKCSTSSYKNRSTVQKQLLEMLSDHAFIFLCKWTPDRGSKPVPSYFYENESLSEDQNPCVQMYIRVWRKAVLSSVRGSFTWEYEERGFCPRSGVHLHGSMKEGVFVLGQVFIHIKACRKTFWSSVHGSFTQKYKGTRCVPRSGVHLHSSMQSWVLVLCQGFIYTEVWRKRFWSSVQGSFTQKYEGRSFASRSGAHLHRSMKAWVLVLAQGFIYIEVWRHGFLVLRYGSFT